MPIDAMPGANTATAAATLSETIEAAMAVEYQALKGVPLPAAGAEDRRMLFNAIAHGLIVYLKAHEADLDLDWTGTRPAGAPDYVTVRTT
jgi:hypothetical protein